MSAGVLGESGAVPRVLPAGDDAWLVELPDLAAALGYRAAVEAAGLESVVELVSGARTVLVRFDAERVPAAEIAATLQALRPAAVALADGPLVEVPVVYDGDDLAETAAALRWTPAELVAWHTGREWSCAFAGFAPGFGYLVPDADAVDLPRLAVPRTAVPAGSVALAGGFSAVYPRSSPGGWRLIGRTALPMWELGSEHPATIAAGSRVRFVDVGSGG